MPPKKKQKRVTPFQKRHGVEFGLQVTETDPQTNLARSVVCRFCEIFGREPKPGMKRKPTKNAQYYKPPFRPELYRRHNATQHPMKWKEYQDLPVDEKNSFFDGIEPIKNTLLSHFAQRSMPKVFQFDKGIIESIIGDMFFDVDDEEDSGGDDGDGSDSDDNPCVDGRRRPVLTPVEIKKRALKVFVPIKGESASEDEDEDIVGYQATIKNISLFQMVVEFARLGASFRLTSRLAQSTRQLTGMACYGGSSPRMVASFLRVMCARNLQMLRDILAHCWTFSLAMDGATHQSTSYLDVRIRFLSENGIENCHLLAPPMTDRHTGEEMFRMIEKVLDVIRPGWKDSLLGVATDGARNMTGRYVGVVTLLDNATGPGFIRVWCGAHQLDLIMADVFDKQLKEDFFSVLTALIGWLRRQQNLIADMGTTCPKVALSRWLSMIKVMKWFKKHRIAVEAHLNLKQPACTPGPGRLSTYRDVTALYYV